MTGEGERAPLSAVMPALGAGTPELERCPAQSWIRASGARMTGEGERALLPAVMPALGAGTHELERCPRAVVDTRERRAPDG
jgi:hypothetical protein